MRSANVTTSGRYDVYNNPNTFYAAVAEFIEEEDNERFQDNIIFKSDGSIEVGDDRRQTGNTKNNKYVYKQTNNVKRQRAQEAGRQSSRKRPCDFWCLIRSTNGGGLDNVVSGDVTKTSPSWEDSA